MGRLHRKMIATEFGPLGGPAGVSISWRAVVARLAVLLLSAMGEEEVVVFRSGGIVPGWLPWSTDLCGSRMANISEVMPVTRNCGMTTKMLCIPYRGKKKEVRAA
jgi:hypothetical protein